MNKLYLVLEYMRRGDLMHVLRGEHSTNTCQALGDLEVWRIFRLVARGVQYLHQQVRLPPVVHTIQFQSKQASLRSLA